MRPFEDSDLETLIEMMRTHLELYVTRHIGPWAESEAMLRVEMVEARADVHVMEVEGEILGFIWVTYQLDHLFLEEIHVVDSARGRGLGRTLMTAVEAQAKAGGHDEIQLGVFKDSAQLGFYARAGFEVVGEFADRHQFRLRKTVSL